MTKYHEYEDLDKLLRLTKLSLDGEASADEASLLARYLIESDEAQNVYWCIVHDELELRTRAEARTASLDGDTVRSKDAEQLRGPLGSLLSWRRLSMFRRLTMLQSWALAASLLFVVGASWFAYRHGPFDGSLTSKQPVADVERMTGAQWILGNGDHTPQVGDALIPGTYSLASGIVELQFRSGASVVVEGPASCELINPMRARLDWGRMVTDVPPEAVGFKVDTENTSVVDLGTRCGIHVGRKFGEVSQTEVHVFEGLVELRPRTSSNLTIRKLAAGEANLIDTQGNIDEWSDISVRPDEFVHQLLPTVVVDPKGQRSKLVDGFGDGKTAIKYHSYYPLSHQVKNPKQAGLHPAGYVAGDFSMSRSDRALRGQIPVNAIDPQFALSLTDAIDVTEFPFFRVRLLTGTSQRAAIYYYNYPSTVASESRYALEPIVGAQADTHREIRASFNVEGLLPDLMVNTIRIDPANIIKSAEEGRFIIDYVFIDCYQTAGIAEFDLDVEEHLQGWSCVGVKAPEIKQSVLRGSTLSSRARISHMRQEIDTNQWSAIEVRLKLDPQAGDAHLGWGKPGDDLSLTKGVPLPNPGDGEFHTYLISLKPQHGWTDRITKLAVWPGRKAQCEFELDYVRVLAMPEADIVSSDPSRDRI